MLALGVGALLHMATQAGRTNPIAFLVLLFFACASSSLHVRLPGVDRTVSLSFAFSFAALIELPVGPAFFIVAAAYLYESWRVADTVPPRAEVAVNLAQAAISSLVTSQVFTIFSRAHEYDRLLALGAAAVTYYGTSSGVAALQLAAEHRRAPWKVWNQKFFWMGPLYLLVPVATAIALLLQRASGASYRLLAIALIFGGYRYVKHYFARLHDRDDHARLLDQIRQRTIEALAVSIEAKDGGTAGHLLRVSRHAMLLAERLGCPEVEIRTLELGALLHDVGKVCVPDYILGKPGRLTNQEFTQMAEHTRLGAQIVEKVEFPFPVGEIVLHHHEHWDGSGYPRGLCGEQIPRLARILTVADCFDALVTDRPYRLALPIDKAVEVLREQRGRIFDPEILDKFLELLPSLRPALDRELQQERARQLLDRTPALKVKQTWLTDAEKSEMVFRQVTFERLAASPEQLILLYEILQILGPGPEAEYALGQTLSRLRRAVPYDQAAIFLVQGDEYVLMEAEGLPSHCLWRLRIPLFHGTLANAVKARRPILAPGPPTEFTSGLHRYLLNARSTLAAPLIADDHVHGVLTLHANRSGAFQVDQAWFAGLITEKLARTIVAAREVQRLRQEAATDPITGLANARASLKRMEEEIERARREDKPLSVLFFDLNRFKTVNDTYGHAAGDLVLAQTAACLQTCLRPYDFLGRLGGDEFLALLPGLDARTLPGKITALKNAVASNTVKLPDGSEISATVSVGAACYPDDARDSEELLFRSDREMYGDKQDPAPFGRGSVLAPTR
jgi:diguanylate cyclase (GGDEF)-like protein/putative nucleotidyltransferase with HDIG domain